MPISIPRYEGVIGLPEDGHAITISNSEREDLACPTRWWFRHVERLKSPETGPKRFGTLWHSVIEEVHRWWQATDLAWPSHAAEVCPFCAGKGKAQSGDGLPLPETCERCDGTGDGVMERTRKSLAEASKRSSDSPGGTIFTTEEAEHLHEHLSRTFDGWLHRYGGAPYQTLRVVGVEVGLARVILNPATGKPYCPETYLLRREDGSMRFAGTGEINQPDEPGEIVVVRWPWFQVARLDAVFAHRNTGALYVGELKSSSDPRGLVSDLTVDPQTSGYVWVLDQPEIRARFGGGEVVGFQFDVVSNSFLNDPDPLKGRPTKKNPNPPLEFSQNRQRLTPSWRYRKTLEAAGVDPAPYAEHLLYLAGQVDPRLHLREAGTVGPDDRARYADEVFAVATRIAAARRSIARAIDLTDVSIAVPRVPICRLPGGSCAYRAPCILDGDGTRSRFEVGTGLAWTTTTD